MKKVVARQNHYILFHLASQVCEPVIHLCFPLILEQPWIALMTSNDCCLTGTWKIIPLLDYRYLCVSSLSGKPHLIRSIHQVHWPYECIFLPIALFPLLLHRSNTANVVQVKYNQSYNHRSMVSLQWTCNWSIRGYSWHNQMYFAACFNGSWNIGTRVFLGFYPFCLIYSDCYIMLSRDYLTVAWHTIQS